MRSKWIRLAACLMALLLLAGCGSSAAPEKPEPQKEETPASDVPAQEPEENAEEPEPEPVPETPEEPEEQQPEEPAQQDEPHEASDKTSELVADMLSKMTTRGKLAQMMMPDIRYYGTEGSLVPVTELTEELYAAVRDLGLGGVILFAENIQSPGQADALTASLQAASEEGGAPVRMLIATGAQWD